MHTGALGEGAQGRAMIDVIDAHLSVEELADLLSDQLSSLSWSFGEQLRLQPLGRAKEGADSTTKALIESVSGSPRAVVVCSRLASPTLVARGVERAEAIRALLAPPLGDAIIRPLKTGEIAGRSFVILPWGCDLPSWRPALRLKLRVLRRSLLDWLHDAVASVARAHESCADSSRTFADELQYLEQQPFLNEAARRAIAESLSRLQCEQWIPRHTFDHNDLWHGNVLLPPRGDHRVTTSHPFVLIDWVGARVRGYGVYDLIRMSRSLRLRPRRLGRELTLHASALNCEPQDLRGHCLAALGCLHRHLEYFPLERFVATFRMCWLTLERGLEYARASRSHRAP